MSELAKKARNAMRDKISRLMRTDPKAKVDGSSYVPPEPLDADVKTGLRPVSRRQFKRGGKVAKMEGGACKPRADRKMRKNGGSTPATPDNIINRDVKEANEKREGKKHVGGMKKGGRAHKMDGGDVAQFMSPAFAVAKNKKLRQALSPLAAAADLKRGGKAEHEDVKMDKALIKKMVHKHEAAKHPGKPMTKLKRGGYAKKAGGGYMNGGNPTPPPPPPPPKMPEDVANDNNAWKLSQEVKREESASKRPPPPPPKKARGGSLDGSLQGTRPTGGRLARKSGGRTKGKGKMNVNIVIGTGGRDGQQPMMPRPGMPAGIPVPVGAPPPAGGPPMGGAMPPPMMAGGPPMGPPPGLPMGGPPGPGGMPPMPRKSGGRAIGVDKPGRVGHRKYRSASDMDAGAASALGRLEKTEIQKHKN